MYYNKEQNSAVLYEQIAQKVKNDKDRETLLSIAEDKQKHAVAFEKYSDRKLKPNYFRTRLFLLVRCLLRYTFLIKLLEYGESRGFTLTNLKLTKSPKSVKSLWMKKSTTKILMSLLDEERLHYIGDIILGMNDALVELTGSLAGYTLAMQNSKIIAMAGLITGISATLSMAGSGYLSAREEESKNAVKSTTIIGLSYFITVVFLILPYLIFPAGAYLWALAVTVLIALMIIAGFNFYISVAKDRPFGKGFWSMAGISIGVAAISFAVGYVVKHVLGISL